MTTHQPHRHRGRAERLRAPRRVTVPPAEGPTVVAALDGTPGSTGALRFAVHEALVRHARLTLVHVIPGTVTLASSLVPAGDLAATSRAVLARAEAAVHDLTGEVALSSSLTGGGRVTSIVTAARRTGAVLLVVGQESRHGVERLLDGTTTAGVVARARCPVAVVPAGWPGPRPSPHRIVVGVDADDPADAVLAHAFATAALHGSALSVVHAWQRPRVSGHREADRLAAAAWTAAGAELVELAVDRRRLEYPEVEVDLRLLRTEPAEALLAAARDADRLVVARRHRPWGLRRHVHPVLHRLLVDATVPVDVVPSDWT